MSKTYKVTGINLKTQPLGESDKIVTILTPQLGLIRAIAPGVRKQNSSLGGRMGIFVINELLIAQGRNLDIITQAETIKTYPKLSQNLGKLAASQYLAEIVVCQALSEQPQPELYQVLTASFQSLEAITKNEIEFVLFQLVQRIFQLLSLAGLTPELEFCCLSQRPLTPDWTNPHWQVGFSIPAGGIICLDAWKKLRKEIEQGKWENSIVPTHTPTGHSSYETVVHQPDLPIISRRLNGKELVMLQHLSKTEIIQTEMAANSGWLSVEQILRQYTQYHLGQPIRSATLIDSYFAANHDAIV
ncbi:MAG: DNA repair protein RecO [Cuspidothrix sp.]